MFRQAHTCYRHFQEADCLCVCIDSTFLQSRHFFWVTAYISRSIKFSSINYRFREKALNSIRFSWKIPPTLNSHTRGTCMSEVECYMFIHFFNWIPLNVHGNYVLYILFIQRSDARPWYLKTQRTRTFRRAAHVWSTCSVRLATSSPMASCNTRPRVTKTARGAPCGIVMVRIVILCCRGGNFLPVYRYFICGIVEFGFYDKEWLKLLFVL